MGLDRIFVTEIVRFKKPILEYTYVKRFIHVSSHDLFLVYLRNDIEHVSATKTQLLHVERGIKIQKWIIRVTCQADNKMRRFQLFLQMLKYLPWFYMIPKNSFIWYLIDFLLLYILFRSGCHTLWITLQASMFVSGIGR